MKRRGLGWGLASALALIAGGSGEARAQTWSGPRITPNLLELIAVDATGDGAWPYGQEDIVGDGVNFAAGEQAIDLRTAYAVTDNQTFWTRAYVAATGSAAQDLVVLVFVDSDENPTTGRTAAAPEIDARLTTDPSNGGYEYVLDLLGDGTVRNVWAYNAGPNAFEVVTLAPNDNADAEVGLDRDPIELIGSTHGYVQGMVDLDLLGLTSACNANLYFRSILDATTNPGDLDVGLRGPCRPADANDDGVPDVAVPPGGCLIDDDCPFYGICLDGVCIIPPACIDDTDCGPDEFCNPDGICFPNPGGSCTDNGDCGDLYCDNGTCGPCTPGSNQCGPGRICAPDGRCIDGGAGGSGAGGGGAGGGLGLNPGDNIQGGAFTCTCAMPGSRGGSGLAALLGLVALGAALGLRRREGR
ncbi:MAG: dickkopf-related protein [Polyangiaceae bacterium]